LLTYLLGGLSYYPLPRYNLEYGSNLIGREENYSLGLSNFFGLSTIAAAFCAMTVQSNAKKVLYCTLIITFLALTFLGGGRGEIIATLVILFLSLLSRLPYSRVMAITVLFFSVAFAAVGMVDVSETVVFQRGVNLFEGDFSSRDSLLVDALHLLQDNPRCLVFGCGVAFFQAYYGFEVGLYPHNVIAESIITFGLPINICVCFLFIRGLIIYWRRVGYVDLLLAFSMFSFIVGLKSGALYSSWLLVASVLAFSCLGAVGFRRSAR
jgi:hypothetical protein